MFLLYIMPDTYSFLTSAKRFENSGTGDKIKLAVIQPNINPWKKWGDKQPDLLHDYASMILQAAQNKPDLMILPETAMPFYLLDPWYEERYNIIKSAVDSAGIPLLTGTPDLYVYGDSSKRKIDSKKFRGNDSYYDTYNSAVLIEKGIAKTDFQRYNKMKLVVGSERMPYQERLVFLSKLITWGAGIGSYQKGDDYTLLTLNKKHKFSVAICYESLFPGFFSEFVKKGAEFSIIITNDGWWGKLFGTYQHNQFAIFRAIENRRWIARCANTGISCFIDPYGNMFNKTQINEKDIINCGIEARNEKSFYTSNGDIFAITLLLITGFLITFAFIKKFTVNKYYSADTSPVEKPNVNYKS